MLPHLCEQLTVRPSIFVFHHCFLLFFLCCDIYQTIARTIVFPHAASSLYTITFSNKFDKRRLHKNDELRYATTLILVENIYVSVATHFRNKSKVTSTRFRYVSKLLHHCVLSSSLSRPTDISVVLETIQALHIRLSHISSQYVYSRLQDDVLLYGNTKWSH